MKCTINDVKLSFDKEDRLRETIFRVSKTDTNKAVVLAGLLTNVDFKKFLLENITEADVLKGETVLFNLFTNKDYVKINQNKLGSLLNDFYKDTYLSVDNSRTIKGMGRLDGFTSAAAKTIAKNHTASLIIKEYRKELVKAPKARRKPLQIIADVNDKMLDTFYNRVNDFTTYLINKDNSSNKAKEMAQQYLELINKLNEINELNKQDNELLENLQNRKDELEQLRKRYNADGRNALKERNKEKADIALKNKKETEKAYNKVEEEGRNIEAAKEQRNQNGAFISRQRYALAHNIITLFADSYEDKQGIKLRNYANLVTQSRANADSWYFQVFNTKNMTSVVKEFNKVEDIEEFIEAQDENNDVLDSKYNENNIDETTKSWEDNLYKNFNQTINGKLRMILSTIPKLSNKFNPNDSVQALDTENELGVSTYMDAQYLTVQIYSFGDFSSIDALIDSIDKKSQTIKAIYGLGQLVNMMKQHKDFANFVYANFAKPIVNKTILTISDISNENGIEFDYSNPNSFPVTEMVFRMSNKVRATYNSTYNAADVTILSNIYNNFIINNDKKLLADELFKVVNRYFPNFNKDVFNNYFDNLSDNEIKDSVKSLIRNLTTVINGIASLKKTINNKTLELNAAYDAKREQYNKAMAAYDKLSAKERKDTPKPEFPRHEYVDYAHYDLNKQIYSGIIGFAQQIANYTDSRAQLNSTNAEGNSASNVLKNCYVTRFFDQIMAESETDSNAGLKNLLAYITQGTNDGSDNQYSNNPLFFGLKDKNGKVIKGAEGMFSRTATGYEINENAKDILKHSLFDGTKNTQDIKAANYASMSKLDFFITQYMAFRDSTAEMTEEGKIKNIGNLNSAVYSMRIGSDAPKIFFIRAPRYTRNQVQYAIYGHLMDEFNMFIKGINGLFVQEGETVVDGNRVPIFKTRTDVNNLIGRAFFNEKAADKLKQSGETDMTSAIIKDGKLQGNLFKFLRLFETNGYNAGKEIENILSLYGGVGQSGILSLDNDGRLRLNPNDIIIYNPSTQKFELKLTQEKKAQLEQVVRDWTNNFLIEAKGRTTGFVKVLEENNIPFNERTLDDFLLNSVNMNMNYDDLFEGDYKYYNGARDFLKRTKESQAGGDGYAGYNITEKFNTTLHDLEWNGSPETITIDSKVMDKNNSPVREPIIINDKPLIAKNGFRGVTIYNTVKTSDYVDDLQKELESIFIEQGMSEENAHNRSVKIASGYGFAGGDKTKINDAQSYITLEEFIRRKHADGTIEDYADLIRQLLDPNIKAEDINLDEINARIQVQKNFYFDKVFDSETGLFYPRQIKNAEFVLIPKLLPKDSELRKIYDWMQANNIGQLNTAETSKAAKKNVFTIWDANTGEFNKDFADNFNESYVEDYYYQYLYKQQDVPQHIIDEHNKAGVQIMKKIIDNIINEEDADNPKRKQLVTWANEYQNAYTANIKEDFINFLDGMGWAYDIKTGTIVNSEYATTDMYGNKLPDDVIETNRTTLNFDNFYIRAREEAARLGMDSNFMEYLIPDEFGNPTMPNFMNIVTAKLESVAQSIYNNKITRQILPGWHAAQITGVGYSERLQFNAKTGVMPVYLPRWSSLIPKGKNAEEDAAILKQIEEEGLDIHIGYRIPTEGKQSISILKVVGFTNEALGSTIVVPDEWVTQTGSDFDVDSVYGISWEMYAAKDKKGNISLHKIPFEEDTIDEQNLYIRYVNNSIDAKIKRTEIGKEIETSIQDIKNKLNFVNERGELNEEFQDIDKKRDDLFNELPGWARGISKDIDKAAKRKSKKDKTTVVDIRSTYPEISKQFLDYLEKHKVPEKDANTVKEYVDYLTGLLDIMNRQDGLPAFDKKAYQSEKAEAIQAIVKKAKDANFKKYEEAAKETGIMSFEEWSKQPFVEKLDRRARNNYIIDRMIKIMNDSTSREEQYGRSNFDKITNGKNGANDIIDKISGVATRPRSPYNPLDQLDYFEDAMGGARLKALSVNWDTFVSKNNKIRATLAEEDAVQVILNLGEKSADDSVISYNEEEIRKSYAEDISDYEENNNATNVTSNIFNIVPLNSIDKKATVKSNMSNKFIGFADGIKNSSTDNYAKQAKAQGVPVNSGNYNSNDIIFVSIPGKRGDAAIRKQQQDLTIREAIKALNAGATILTDTKEYTDNSDYNEGEKRLKANLEYLGINYSEINGVGVWNKNKVITELNKQNNTVDKEYLLFSSGNKDFTIKESRINELKPLINNLENDSDLITIPYREFIKYNAKVSTSDGSYLETKDEIKDFLLSVLDKEYKDMPFKKGEFYITKTMYELLQRTTPEEFIGILNGYDTLTTNENVKIVDRIITNDIINKFLSHEQTTENDLIKTINDVFDEGRYYNKPTHVQNGEIVAYNIDIAKEVIDNNEFKQTYPNAYEILLSKYNEKNGITDVHSTGEETKSKRILFTARRLGWSRTNRNIVGDLVTTYTSQTTAHHLDAVKMGSVPNVDEFTFSTYKFLSTLGIDFENVIGFMRQPVITNLVANNNLIKSTFVSSSNQAIKMTLADIANKLGLRNGKYSINYNTSNNKIIDAFKANIAFVQQFNTLFGIDISNMNNQDIMNIKLPLDKQRMFTRIKRAAQNKGDVISNAAFDFGMLLTFRNIQRSAEKVNRYISATAADKFGAKPSIHETRRTVELINELRSDYALSKDGKSFIELIYPSADEYHSRIDVENSEYKSISAVYAYATNPSLQTNTKLFITENDDFDITEHIIQQTIHHKFTEPEYKEYKRYAISYLYNEIQKLLMPLMVNNKGRIIPNTEIINQTNSELKTANDYWNEERSRICGYGVAVDGDFDIKNVNKPTKADINKFNKLTPAQKVLFIQKHFPDNQGIFNYVKVTLLNNTDVKYRGISRQYLSFDDQVDDIEDLLYLFTNSFSNHNPLIKLAAIDLIKYAFIAEGFNYKSGYISKIVPNETLYKSIEEGGLDIIDELKSRIKELPYIMRNEEFIDQYVRSHSDIIPIKRLRPLPKKVFSQDALEEVYTRYNESTQFLASMRADKLVHIDATVDNINVESLISSLDLFRLAGGYTKVAFPIDKNHSNTILYKVEGHNEILDKNNNIIGYKDYFLVPLNLLDKYETYEYSYNKNYNIFNSKEYYDYTIQELDKQITAARDELFNSYYLPDIDANIDEYIDENTKKRIKQENNSIRGKVNRNIPSIVMPVGGYQTTEINLADNKDGLMELYDGGDDFTKGGVQKLVDGIVAHVKNTENNFSTPYVQFNPNISLKRLIPVGSAVTQNIVMNDGSTMNVTIAHHKITDKFGKEIEQMMLGHADAGIYAEAIKDLNDTQTLIKNADIYRITKTKENPKKLKENALKAATDLIVDTDESVVSGQKPLTRRGRIDVVSSAIINEISYDARKNNTPIANSFIHELERYHVNRNMGSSIIENRGNIYRSAARYYRSAANTLINKLNAFQMLDKDGNPATYSMDDAEMYKALAVNDEYFREVADIILRGITFGNRIADIMKLDITAEDKETKEAVQQIINSINSIRQNKKLADAMNNIINIYFKKYSTNPEVVRGILDLRESFGDLDKIDALIADPTDIDNNETQVILKQVYTMFAKAEMFDARNNVREWKEKLAEIEAMSGTMDINKVIDSERGMIRQAHNTQFLEDRQKVIDDLNEAYNNRNNSLADFEKYIRAKYERDKFMYENTEQHIVDEYYKQDLALRDEVMRKAGSIYFKYMQLSQQLYDTNSDIEETDEETSNRKRRIISAMHQLRSEVDATGAEKSIEDKAKARVLDKFITKRRELMEKYFDSQEYDGFQEDYKRYKNYIDSYDAEHKYDTLEKKLADDVQYKEAYDWIKNNGRVAFGKEESIKLRKAFKDLTGRVNVIKNKTIAQLRSVEGAIDESGMINPMKLTDEQIAQIRNEELSDLAKLYDNSYGEMILIKDVPKDIPLMYPRPKKKNNDEDIYAELKYKDNVAKVTIITEINSILGRCIDKNTGHLDIATLFNNNVVSDEERVKLASLYNQLRNLRTEKMKRYKKRKNKVYADNINDVAFLDAMNYYRTNLQNTKQGKQFLDIFTELDHTGNVVANSYIYGYRIPDAEYIDNEKTAARDYIEKNVDFVPNEYYYIAKRQAQEQGVEAYDKWFKLNHVYNPYSHKWEALKIWTKLEAKPNSELANSIQYVPSFDNMERSVKSEYINPKYKEFSSNYKKGNSKYDSNITLNKKEEALRDLYINTLNKYATTYQGKRFVGQGYLPRERRTEVDTRWALGQLGALMGMSWHSGADSDSFHKEVDYSHDREAEMKMLSLLKGKGTREYKHLPIKGTMSDKEYAKEVAKIREENRQIKAENEKIDNAALNRNWNEVMENFVHNATIFNSRQAAKPYLYLLLEDLAVNNAYMIKGIWGKKLIKDTSSSTDDDTTYMTVPQTRTREIVHNLARRLLYNQYHENNTPRAIANFLQNLTSAKYMVFNLYGGIANITTGKVNIAAEEFANEYFGFSEFAAAEKQYLMNSAGMIASMYSDKAPNLTAAFIKQFNIVEFDQILQYGAGSANLDENLRRVRDWMYSFQSVGEHYMQNSVLLAMLKSNRLYTDKNGVQRIGDFKDFTWNIEKEAMEQVLKDNEILFTSYRTYVEGLKDYVEHKYEISTNKKDLNRSFLYSLRDNINPETRALYRKTAEAYHKKREELMKDAKEQFMNNPTVESLYEFKNGEAVLKKSVIDNFNAKGKNPIGDLEHIIAGFKRKIEAVNKKIHGVYDKDGAAQIESKWWGSLVMQYHKHLYNGIFKRWRKKGFYSEFRGSRERGSYITFMNFLGTEFTNFKKRAKNKEEDGTNIALASIQVAMESALNTLTNIEFNWNNLSNWEKANIKRNLGDISGVLVAALVVMALYGLFDDDDLKDDAFKASLLYLADRLYSESSMYSPVGLVTEYKTAWSSPIASANGPSDLLKAMLMIPQALFDPDFNPEYQSGQYAGMNKFAVLFRRNLPGIRPWDRIQLITKNNKYYKVGESQIGVNIAKNFGEMLNE